MLQIPKKFHVFVLYVLLVVLTFAAYEPVLKNDFINLDDDGYVTKNPHVRAGITTQSVLWAFTASHRANWHPLTWLSHMLDCELFGLNPRWHHLTSLLFHIVNTLLLFGVLKGMTGAVWRSIFVAAAFAVHPLHVESVAWIAERKDVLSVLFCLITMAAYLRYVRRPSVGSYLPVVFFFCLGLMAKFTLVTLPFVLLLLDYWPLERFCWSHRRPVKALRPKSVKFAYQKSSVRHLIGEKIPLLVLAAASSIVTYTVQRAWGSVVATLDKPLSLRIANALVSYLSYITKAIYPNHLAIYYPHPESALPVWQLVICLIVLTGITIGVICLARRRYLMVGWLWYLGTLVPVIGLVQVGLQARADRYTYLPLIGIFIMVVWLAAEITEKWRYQKPAAAVLITILVLMMLSTRNQVMKWRNSKTLYEHTLACTENNFMIYTSYGTALFDEGRYDEAIENYRMALEIEPGMWIAKRNIGRVLLEQDKVSEAIVCLKQVLPVSQDSPEVYGYLGLAYTKQGEHQLAAESFKRSLKLLPNQVNVLNELGRVLYKNNRINEAIEYWEKSIGLYAEQPAIHNVLGQAYHGKGLFVKAADHWTKSLALEPFQPDVKGCLGAVFAKQQKYDKAIECLVETLYEDPDLADVHKNLAALLVHKGNTAKAVKHYIEYLRIEPNQPLIHKTVAELLYRQGDLDGAVTHYNHSLQIDCNQADMLRNLGHIYYLKNSIVKAVDCWHKALDISADCVEALNDLAWVKATRVQSEFFDPEDAVNLALQACELTDYNRAELLDTLAAAHAASGNFPEAVRIAEKAINIALMGNQQDLAVQIREHLELFRQKTAYVERSH
ncbi:MAG: tetratricopeptide repeat protein [Sedimentisphaerales bacterium]|nr:tetratricopeptide repeat protein [Sedimentisphaerales bacterium]